MPEARRVIRVALDGYPDPPPLDTLISHALLERVSAGLEPETLRLFRPARVLAFGPSDRLQPGYPAAREAARAASFAPVERLAGGRAAVFHEGTIAFAWALPDRDPRAAIHRHFRGLANVLREALGALGLDARVGAVPGEYCPGDYSINARGVRKIAGVGQRLAPAATHVGGVIVVSGAELVRAALVPVYAALALDWEPSTAGSIEDEVGPVEWEVVRDAVLAAFAERYDLVESALSAETLARAAEIAGEPSMAEAAL
jgi:octanoyl-[GcvH]:protein N-octanoyltransferase